MSAIPFDFNTLATSGVLGVILAWFMYRLEGIMKEQTKATQEMRESFLKLCEVINEKLEVKQVG